MMISNYTLAQAMRSANAKLAWCQSRTQSRVADPNVWRTLSAAADLFVLNSVAQRGRTLATRALVALEQGRTLTYLLKLSSTNLQGV